MGDTRISLYFDDRQRRVIRVAAAIATTLVLVGSTLFLSPAPVANAAVCAVGSNPIVCENSKPGNPASEWDISGSGDPSIQGFSTDISVNIGGKIDFKIDTRASAYTVAIYRSGWYQGLGARRVTAVAPSATLPQTQPSCVSDLTTGLYDCGNWGVSASWNVPVDAVSGVYFALLTRNDTGGTSHITFIVRDESSRSAVLFQTSDPSWQAYNTYGGSDFYQGGAVGRAYKISYNRPVATRGAFSGRDFYFANEYPMVRFLEKNGYDVSYFSGVDTDRFGPDLLNHKVFLSVGHDEYWSTGQRANVEAARAAGVNLQFLSGNEAYWHTRYESSSTSGTSTPYRTLVSYKETWSNAKIDPSPTWTGTWRDPRFASQANGAGLPENNLTGTQYMANFSDLPITVNAAEGKTRLWRNTSLTSLAAGASQALALHTIGYESNEDVDNGFRQPGLIRLSTTTGAVAQYLQDYGTNVAAGTTTHHVTLYRATSGALVFSAGSIQWTWGLDQEHDGSGAPADARMMQAEVNLLADMGAQPGTLDSALVAASASTDSTPPTVSITAPLPGAAIANGARVTVTGTAADVGGVVAGVAVSTDAGATWHAATGTTSWSYTYVQNGSGAQPIQVHAIDDSANYPAVPSTVTVTVGGPYSAFGATVPATPDGADTSANELGLKFTPSINGFVSGVRFYKSAANTGVHTGSLWSSTGIRLATVNFSGETATGWQTATFSSGVAVSAGTTYVVSYSAPNGHYAATSHYWGYRGDGSGPVTIAGGFGAAPAGVFGTLGSFPTNSGLPSDGWYGSNYFVDAVFTTVDTSPLVATNQLPLNGSSSVPANTTISAQLSKPVTAGSVAISVVDPNGVSVTGSTSYDATARNATFTPSAVLNGFVKYSVSLTATDAGGNPVSSGGTWSFTTVKPAAAVGVCPCSLFDDSVVPTILQAGDANTSLNLGVKFTPTASGFVSGVQFYKGPGNTGTHVGSLWSAGGVQLASATFANESTSGWQTVTFSSPVSVTAGAVYTAAYSTTSGNYSLTPGGFTSGFTKGPLQVGSSAGAYSYTGTYPSNPATSNYLVDVVFNPTAVPLAVVSQSPASGAVAVYRGSAIVVVLSTAVVAGYSLTATSLGSNVAGATSLSSDSKTITFTPTSALPNNALVQATLSGVATSGGAQLATQTWSFTTADTNGMTLYSLFSSETPTVLAAADNSSVELGVSFTPSAAGSVTAIKFFKSSGNTGTHTGHLWSAAGTLLATVTFANETATGWQTAQLSSAVALTPGQLYVVSYLAPNGNYSYTSNYFATAKTVGPLTADVTSNGRYLYTPTGGFPTNSWGAANYFVDLVYSAAASPAPTPALVGSLFSTETPTVLAATADTASVELGVSFTPSVNGSVAAIQFFKGAGNTGTHTGHLWSSAGALLATVTFTNETATGWQSATLSTPVALTAGQSYVASYLAPKGNYSYTSNYFATAKTVGPLTAPALNNGRYLYGATGGFPTNSWGSTNYFVDLTFTAAP